MIEQSMTTDPKGCYHTRSRTGAPSRSVRRKGGARIGRWRAIAVFTLLSSSVVLAVTGGIMYFWRAWGSPPLGWAWHHWSDIHSAASVIFLFGVFFHVALNAKALSRHLTSAFWDARC